MTLAKAVSMKYNKTIEKCSNEEIYYALLDMTKQMAEDKVSNEGKKKLYYISAEFLIGKLLSNNLINLGIYDSVKSRKWWTWTSGSMFSGFYRNTRIKR